MLIDCWRDAAYHVRMMDPYAGLRNNADPFWRRLRFTVGLGHVSGEIEDNVHHFRIRLDHDGDRVTATSGEALRVPWTTCPGAVAQLDQLVGTSVCAGARIEVDQAQQCTHMLDTAKLALAQVARDRDRSYEIGVRDGDDSQTCAATIDRDGQRLFEWIIRGDEVVAPPMFAGHVVIGRSRWSSTVEAEADLREAALALRRAVFIFRSRPRSKFVHRAVELPALANACFSFQTLRVKQAVRPLGFVELD